MRIDAMATGAPAPVRPSSQPNHSPQSKAAQARSGLNVEYGDSLLTRLAQLPGAPTGKYVQQRLESVAEILQNAVGDLYPNIKGRLQIGFDEANNLIGASLQYAGRTIGFLDRSEQRVPSTMMPFDSAINRVVRYTQVNAQHAVTGLNVQA
jgi:hypothetical protein